MKIAKQWTNKVYVFELNCLKKKTTSMGWPSCLVTRATASKTNMVNDVYGRDGGSLQKTWNVII